MYCLQIPLNYFGSKKKGKVCVAIGSLSKLIDRSNIMYFRTDFPWIEIRNNTIVSLSDMGEYMKDFYNVFESFIEREIMPIFPEYHLDR